MSFGSDEIHCCDGYTYRGLRVGRLFVAGARVGAWSFHVATGKMVRHRDWVVMLSDGEWLIATVDELSDALRVADDVMLNVDDRVLAEYGDHDNEAFRLWRERLVVTGRYEPFPGSRVRTEAA